MLTMNLRFVWDADKNLSNARKHGVTFEEAATVFENHPLEIFHDPDHSLREARFIAAGFSDEGRVLLVVHCENAGGTVIRIISARKPTKNEARQLFRGER
jgi:uncharacterized protein